MLKYLFLSLVLFFACCTEKEKKTVNVAPAIQSVMDVSELIKIGIPPESNVIHRSDGGGRSNGYYQWLVKGRNFFEIPKDSTFEINELNSPDMILGLINSAGALDLNKSDIFKYWSGDWSDDKDMYDICCINTTSGEYYVYIVKQPEW